MYICNIMTIQSEILSILKENLNFHESKILNIYRFGSYCYGTYNELSDQDFTIIAKNDVENIEYNISKYNFHIQTVDYFQERLDWNDPKSFECLLYPPILEKHSFNMNIIDKKFRHAVSHISSNSWVKAKKKIEQGDIYIGQKSLYHSIRIPMFAIQIKKYDNIIDWECANIYWSDIKQIEDWSILKNKYQSIRNIIMSEFRQICKKQ